MMQSEDEAISRRHFLEHLMKIGALGIVGSGVAACASGGLPLMMGQEENEQIRIRLSETPTLNLPDGAIALATTEEGN
ncbi:MAG: hypothetical protein ONB46_12770 [candidate division KSB1 bacterium]|nr:hypothetical protein [candidate division KSB1 bacterium]MDZ7366590.1 hypothetical protein [candidate division KSB1 bacterium]MDZ7406692.1 hypothetical protein [candidate division KSB1 bacterium]